MAAPTTMRALRAHVRGGPEVLVYEDAPVPRPAADEILVEVHAAAITFDELTWDETWQRDGHDRTPVIVSHEFSGVIAGLGDGVTSVAVGDDVYGLVPFDRDGAAADYVTLPAEDVAAKPASVDHVAAAAVPLAALTAWQALVHHAHVQRGERVLIQGGAGGVGGFATQLAAFLGADVTATGRDRDLAAMHSFGAHHLIDIDVDEISTLGPFDVVIDTVGGEWLDQSLGLVRPGGRLVTLSAPPPADAEARYGIQTMFFIVTPDRGDLTRIAELIDAGRLQAKAALAVPVADGRAAFESRGDPTRPPGKVVLVVRG